MNETYLYAFGAVFLISVVSLIGVFTLSIRERTLHSILFVLVSIAAGALFGDALIHLLPEALEEGSPALVSLSALSGIVLFLIFEKFLRWRHSHDTEGEESDVPHGEILHGEVKPVGYLVLVSDGLHNLVDGIIIGTSFLVGTEVGIATTIAVVLHEIPQEISDFGLLIHAGFSKVRALLLNFFSALLAFVGAGIGLLIGESFAVTAPYIAAFSAGSFLYIAGSDLVPEIHQTKDIRRSLIQLFSIVFGIGIMFLLLCLE